MFSYFYFGIAVVKDGLGAPGARCTNSRSDTRTSPKFVNIIPDKLWLNDDSLDQYTLHPKPKYLLFPGLKTIRCCTT